MNTRRAVLPLPSLLHTSANDAANARMRKAGRTRWSRSDYNASAEALDQLVAGAYGEGPEGWSRFSVAAELERAGRLSLRMTAEQLNAAIDAASYGR